MAAVTGKVEQMFVGSSAVQIQIAGTWYTLPSATSANYQAFLTAANNCVLYQVMPTLTVDGSNHILTITIPTGNP